MPSSRRPLRIAWLIYRGNPHCGGQGVYTRYLARELTELGHHVEVLSGQPWPELDDPVAAREGPQPRPLPPRQPVPGAVAVGVPGPDRPPGVRDHVRGRVPRAVHVQPAGPEPPARPAAHEFDLIHDNQCLGTGLLGLMDDGWPVRRHAAPPDHGRPRPRHARTRPRRGSGATLRRWYGFLEHADEGRAADPAARHRVARTRGRDIVAADGRRPRTGCTSCRSASTRRASARCRTSRACPVAS